MAQTVFSQYRTVADYFVLSFQEEIEFLTHRAPRISPEWYQFAALKVGSKSVGHLYFAPARFLRKIQFDLKTNATEYLFQFLPDLSIFLNTPFVGEPRIHSIKSEKMKTLRVPRLT